MVAAKARGAQGPVEHRGGEPVRRGVNALPAEAEALVARIEGMLAQAEALLARGGSDEAAYALRETERRYLPDTLDAYLGVPPARRDATAATMLVEQLRLLERATAQRLAVLAESAENALAANGGFLTERFGALETLPETGPAADPPATGAADGAGPARARTARRRAGADPSRSSSARPYGCPRRSRRSRRCAAPACSGRGPVEDVALDVPRRDDVLRYALSRRRTASKRR